MSIQLIVDEPYARVWADEAVPCIVVQLHSFANRDQFKALMNAGLAHYQAHSHPARRWGWVGDTRRMSAIPKDVQQWLAQEWNVHAYAAGLREISIVTSENIMGQLATQQYAQQALAQPEKYQLQPVYYSSLAQAQEGAAKRCAALQAAE